MPLCLLLPRRPSGPRRPSLVACAALVAASLARPAAAQPTQPTPAFEPPADFVAEPAATPPKAAAPLASEPPAPRRAPSGFFLRFGMGPGFVRISSNVETFVGSYQAKVRSAMFECELVMGAAPRPGLVVAGALVLDVLTSPRIDENGSTHAPSGTITHGLVGPMVDWYPSPAGGFHTGALVGFAEMDVRDDQRKIDSGRSRGIGVAPHVGYDVSIGDGWAMGLVARLRYARALGDFDSGLPTGAQHDEVIAGAVTLAFTFR